MATTMTLTAQSPGGMPKTMQAIMAAGADSEHLCVSIGQPFFEQKQLGDYEFSMGVAQAQVVNDTVYDVITYNTPYTQNDFNLPAQTGTHKDSVYIVNGGIYNYDLIRTLFLIVCPEKLTDAYSAGIQYDVQAVSGYCWTKQNLRSPVEGAMAFSTALHPTVPETYGLLYTWNAALGTNATPDADGYVQGICPNDKWHIPDAAEIDALTVNSAETLRSLEDWVNGAANTNATGFTAYPAGFYNSATQRFEGLCTQTDWWTMVNPGSTGDGSKFKTILELACHCDASILIHRNPNDAASVRCVMKNEWPE